MNKNKKIIIIISCILFVIVLLFLLFKGINEDKNIHKIKVHTDKGTKRTLEIPKTDPDFKTFTYYFEYDVAPEHYEEYLIFKENGDAYKIFIHGGHEPERSEGTIYKVGKHKFELDIDGRTYKIKEVKNGLIVSGHYLMRTDGKIGFEERLYTRSNEKQGE